MGNYIYMGNVAQFCIKADSAPEDLADMLDAVQLDGRVNDSGDVDGVSSDGQAFSTADYNDILKIIGHAEPGAMVYFNDGHGNAWRMVVTPDGLVREDAWAFYGTREDVENLMKRTLQFDSGRTPELAELQKWERERDERLAAKVTS